MCHGKHGNHLVTGRNMTLGVVYVGAEVAVSEHYALRVSGAAGSVVDGGKVVPVVCGEYNILRAEAGRIFLLEQGVQVVYGFLDFWVTAEKHFPVVDVEDHLDGGHLLRVHLGPAGGVGEKGYAVTVIDKTHHAFRGEIGKNGDNDGLVSIYCEVCEAPLGTVVGAEGYLVSLLEAGFFKNDVETGNSRSHLSIGERITADGIEGRLVPELAGSVLKALKVMRIISHILGLRF